MKSRLSSSRLSSTCQLGTPDADERPDPAVNPRRPALDRERLDVTDHCGAIMVRAVQARLEALQATGRADAGADILALVAAAGLRRGQTFAFDRQQGVEVAIAALSNPQQLAGGRRDKVDPLTRMALSG